MLSAMLLTGCVSPRIEYVEKPMVPALSFPVFPVLEGGEKKGDGTVSVPEEWIVRLSDYRIRIEETEKTYMDLKALCEGEE